MRYNIYIFIDINLGCVSFNRFDHDKPSPSNWPPFGWNIFCFHFFLEKHRILVANRSVSRSQRTCHDIFGTQVSCVPRGCGNLNGTLSKIIEYPYLSMVSLKPDPNEKGEARSRAKREVPIISRAWYLWVHFHWAWRWNFSKAPWQEGKFPGLPKVGRTKACFPSHQLPIDPNSHLPGLVIMGMGMFHFSGGLFVAFPDWKWRTCFPDTWSEVFHKKGGMRVRQIWFDESKGKVNLIQFHPIISFWLDGFNLL